jgi:hypothetical protein
MVATTLAGRDPLLVAGSQVSVVVVGIGAGAGGRRDPRSATKCAHALTIRHTSQHDELSLVFQPFPLDSTSNGR